MPSTSRAIHPSGLGITFTETGHTYIDDTGHHYTSGTKIVSKVKPPFDPTGKITKDYAAKHNKSVDAIKARWNAKGVESCRYGTRLHENAENLLEGRLDRIHAPQSEKEAISFSVVAECVKYLQSNYTLIATEQIVFSQKLKIAGSIDLLMADPVSKTLWIFDWKSNEKIERVSNFNNYMLDPVAHLDDVNFNHYSLQLCLYERLIVREGYMSANGMQGWKVRRMIIHIPPIQKQPVWIECRALEVETADMIINHLTDIPF